MTSTNLYQHVDKWLSKTDRELFYMLNEIKTELQSMGPNQYNEFKVNLLKCANYRLMQTYKQFDLSLLFEKCANGSTEKQSEINMNNIMQTPMYQATTPFVMRDKCEVEMFKPSNATPNAMLNKHSPDSVPNGTFQSNSRRDLGGLKRSYDNDIVDALDGPSTKTSSSTMIQNGCSSSNGHAMNGQSEYNDSFLPNGTFLSKSKPKENDVVSSEIPFVRFGTTSIDNDGDFAIPNGLPIYQMGENNEEKTHFTHPAETTKRSTAPDRREWMCFYCKKEKIREIRNFTFSSITELHEHWTTTHHSNGIAFRFYVVDLLRCNVNKCNYYSNFLGLQNHHNKNHSDANFVPIYKNRCALCMHSGADLDAHKCDRLATIAELKMCNPCLLTNNELDELQAVQEHKQFRCKYCDQILQNRQEMRQHHQQNHGDKALDYDQHRDASKAVVQMICGCCQTEISPQTFAVHLKSMARKRWAQKCWFNFKWTEWFRRFEIDFLKTQMIFRNGLVLYKQNLMETNFGNHGFEDHAKQLFQSLNNPN